MKLTVVVPTYNRSDLLGQSLEHLLDQTAPGEDFEIMVVDDGSTDATSEVAAQVQASAGERLRYVRQENKGPAAARNLGVREAKGTIVLFTGDDCLPDRRLVEEHLRAHGKEGDVGVVGHVAWHPELTITPFMSFLEEGAQFGFKLIKDPSNVTAWSFYTANCSVQRHWIEEAGGFDEDFKHAAYEDIELAYRMQHRGLRIVYRPSALTYHHHETTLKRFLLRQKICGQSAVLFARKHPELGPVLGLQHAARAETVVAFFKTVVEYAYALGVREALRLQPAGPEDGLEALWEDADLAKAGDAWQQEIFAAVRRDLGNAAVELVWLRAQLEDLQREWERVTARRLYRWSESAAKLGWRVLRKLGVKGSAVV